MIVIFIAALIVWTVLILYIIHLDRRMRELEKRMEER
jgi:CcmD family protein